MRIPDPKINAMIEACLLWAAMLIALYCVILTKCAGL